MMHYTHDVHSWSKLYREERLAEAQTTQPERRLRKHRGPGGTTLVGAVWRHTLALLRLETRSAG